MQKAKKILHSLDKYLALGFDIDHCLLRYKIKQVFPVLYKAVAKVLVDQKSYPKEILEFGKRERCFLMNGLVVDFKTGMIFKLGQEKEILRAYYGFSPVPKSKLEELFGSPPKYDIFDPYKTRTSEYLCCLTFFECYLPALLAHMVEFKEKEGVKPEVYLKDVLEDINHALHVKYTHFHEDVHHPVANYGYYLKEAVEDLDSMLYKQDKMKGLLQVLRQKGKILFFASNSHFEYINIIMEHSLGKDWKDLFDFIIPNASKPGFFTQPDRLFREVDVNAEDKFGKEVEKLELHKMYSLGNAKLLEENVRRVTGKEGRILFFGDNYSTDALAAEKHENWDAVCIMEEMGDIDFGDGYDQSYWGHWKYEEVPGGKIPTFWYDFMSKNVAVCTSLVDSLEMAEFYNS